MALDEVIISQAIIERFLRKFTDSLEVDCAVVGGGPAGLVAAYYLVKAGYKVSLFETQAEHRRGDVGRRHDVQ